MQSFGAVIRNARESRGFLLRQVAVLSKIDKSILSKIEKGCRKPTREHISKLSEVIEIDKEILMIQYLSDKIVSEIVSDECASKALKVAEKKIKIIKAKGILK